MCLIVFAYQMVEEFPLIIAANRDEFYERPTAPLHVWKEKENIVGGRDLLKGGTWFAANQDGTFAALTNIRQQGEIEKGKSRGELIPSYLRSKHTQDWLRWLKKKDNDYPGYNLIAGTKDEIFYYSNRQNQKVYTIQPGIHGLSNAHLNTPWPKVERAKKGLEDCLIDWTGSLKNYQRLFSVMMNAEAPIDDHLPDTGVGLEMERMLSPIFIHGGNYGTRSQSLLTVKDDGSITFIERSNVHKGTREERWEMWQSKRK